MSVWKCREHLGRIAEVMIELMASGAFLWTVHHGVLSQLARDGMTLVCSEDGVFIRLSKGSV